MAIHPAVKAASLSTVVCVGRWLCFSTAASAIRIHLGTCQRIDVQRGHLMGFATRLTQACPHRSQVSLVSIAMPGD